MLGTLNRNKEGIVYVFVYCLCFTVRQTCLRLMEEAKLFTAFYHLSELRSREDLIKGIIENIDYSMFVFLNT
jgi:Rapamycin-insensitive companion of mTOR, middle domain